jgi:outer membrane protein TolC
LLPALNFILGTYVSGLHSGGAFLPAYSDQFNLGRPSYSTGLTFDMPLGNRAAKSRMQQRRLEIRQITNQMQTTVANIRADVEIAVREVGTTHREMQSKHHAMLADQAEIQYLTERWRLLPGDQQVAGVMLDNLLNAQERLADDELGFAGSLVAYNVALVKLKWATGTLLNCEYLQQRVTCEGGLPTMTLGGPPAVDAPARSPAAVPPPAQGMPAAVPQPSPPPVFYDEAQVYRLPRVE